MRLPPWVRRVSIAKLAAVVLAAVVLGYLAWDITELNRQQKASCVVFADVGDAQLITPATSVLGRKIVMDSAHAARIIGCAR